MIRTKLTILALLAIVILLGLGYFVLSKALNGSSMPHSAVCTLEAKICPDGSAVGRTGPNCEFTECPNTGTVPYTGKGVTFMYPQSLSTTYIHPQNWPPEVTITSGTLMCNDSGNVVLPEGLTTKKAIAGRDFCVNSVSDGAAGSVYTTYSYKAQNGKDIITVTFTLRSVQCANYDDPKKTECEKERSLFDIDTIAARIALSAKRI